MKITIDLPESAGKALMGLALVSGRPASQVASIELAAYLKELENPWELLGLVINSYCSDPADLPDLVQRFRQYRDERGLPIEDCEIEGQVAEEIGEVDPGQGWIIEQAGRIMARPDSAPRRR